MDKIVITECKEAQEDHWNVYEIVHVECRHNDISPHPAFTISVPRLSKNLDHFSDIIESALHKLQDTKKIKHSIQHYCTAVTNRRYITVLQ